MELIQSFSVDHTRIVPGIFTSRVDNVGGASVTTYDIRLKRPNVEPVIDVAAMHSLEHIIATYMRNDPAWKDEVKKEEDEFLESQTFTGWYSPHLSR